MRCAAKGAGSGPLQPGEAVDVGITATDPQGKPVAAELSLAMVQQTLLDRFPETLPPIQDYFQGQHRQSGTRTAATITFAYNPATEPINPRLLTEEEARGNGRGGNGQRRLGRFFRPRRIGAWRRRSPRGVEAPARHAVPGGNRPQPQRAEVGSLRWPRPKSGGAAAGGSGQRRACPERPRRYRHHRRRRRWRPPVGFLPSQPTGAAWPP